jgi:hypothetical protein
VTWAVPSLVFNVADLFVVVGCASVLIAHCCGRRHSLPAIGFTARTAGRLFASGCFGSTIARPHVSDRRSPIGQH